MTYSNWTLHVMLYMWPARQNVELQHALRFSEERQFWRIQTMNDLTYR